MEPPSTSLARWLPAVIVWSAILLSLMLDDAAPAPVVLARGDVVPCPALPPD